MAFSAMLAVELLLAAFAGGAFGAAIGAFPALSFAGVLIVVGEAIDLSGEAVGITGSLGLGAGFGPHTAFAGGVAATAYAARRGYMDTGFRYGEAKNVTAALGTEPDVLAVGGIFGIIGHWLAELSGAFALPWDPIFASIVASAFLHRIAFGYPLIGSLRTGLLDMSPFERGERRQVSAERVDAGSDAEREARQPTRYVVEPWLPHQYEWPNVATLGLAVGIFSGFVAVQTGSAFLAFGFTAASLLFLKLGTGRMPVTHHMAFPASIAALSIPGASPTIALMAGGLFGITGGLAGELSQRVFYAHADTHLDPPAASIVLNTLLIALLTGIGVFEQGIVPALGL